MDSSKPNLRAWNPDTERLGMVKALEWYVEDAPQEGILGMGSKTPPEISFGWRTECVDDDGTFPVNSATGGKKMADTEITDTNGDNVYEKDIIRVTYTDAVIEESEKELVGVVGYQDGGFVLLVDDEAFYLSEYVSPVEDSEIEVIGNRFENPEVLED